MSGVTLHDYWRSSASYRVRIGLGLKGLDWTTVPVDLAAGAQRGAAHRTRNPQGRVPVLEIDGHCLTQSLAILDYLDETRPEPPYLPADPAGRARVRALAHAIAMDIHPLCNLNVLTHVESLMPGPDSRADWVRHFMMRGLASFEQMLEHRDTGLFCHGDAPGLADICLVPQVYNARRWSIDLGPCSRLTAIAQRCETHPAFAAAHPDRVRP